MDGEDSALGRWHPVTAVATNLAGSSSSSRARRRAALDSIVDGAGLRAGRPVQLRLDGASGATAPADSAVLVVRDRDGEQVARQPMKWTDEGFDLAVSRTCRWALTP